MKNVPKLSVVLGLAVCAAIIFWRSGTRTQVIGIETPPANSTAGEQLVPFYTSGDYGYLDCSATWAIEPQFWNAGPFSEGLAAVLIKDGWWGYIDPSGAMVIDPSFGAAGQFSEGLAVALDSTKGKWGYIDRSGSWAIEPAFDAAEPFRAGIARVGIETTLSRIRGQFADVGITARYKFIDGTGDTVSPDDVVSRDTFALIQDGSTFKFETLDRKHTIQGQFLIARPFTEGRAAVRTDQGWGFIARDGSWIVDPRYEGVSDFSDGIATVSMSGKLGWVDHAGSEVVSPQFDQVLPFIGSCTRVWTNGQGFLADRAGALTQP